MIHRRDLLATAAAWAAASLPAPARAQTYPDKPIRFVVPLAAGGSADLLARLVGQHLGRLWGQPVVVEMKPGGGTIIGSNVVAKAAADGYTILFAANSLVINAKLRSNLPYDGLKAFEPVALMAQSPQVLAVSSASPHRTLAAWLGAARANPGGQSIATLGPATTQHVAAELLQISTGTRLIYVPYAGGALAVNAVLGGHVDAVLCNLAEAAPHLEAGKLRALGVSTRERLEALKDVPTIAESGYPGFEAVAWFGVAAPAGTPADIVARLADGLQSAMNDGEIRRQLLQHGLQPAYLGPAAFASHIRQSFERYSRIIDEAGIAPG